MPAFLDRAVSFIVTAAAVVAGLVLVALMLLTTADVIGRYFFNAPLRGVFDLTHFAVLIMTFFGFAYCAYHGHHVVIEIVYSRCGPRARDVIKRIGNLAGAAIFAAIGWQAAVAVADIRAFKFSSQLLLVPFWPFYYALAFGAFLFALVLALQVVWPLPDLPETENP